MFFCQGIFLQFLPGTVPVVVVYRHLTRWVEAVWDGPGEQPALAVSVVLLGVDVLAEEVSEVWV